MEQVALQVSSGSLIGFVTGWGLKKLIRIIIKLAAIILAAFFGGLLWLEVQKIITVNWKELENQTTNSVGWIANATVTNSANNQVLNQIIDTLGLPFAAPMGMAFLAGFIKG